MPASTSFLAGPSISRTVTATPFVRAYCVCSGHSLFFSSPNNRWSSRPGSARSIHSLRRVSSDTVTSNSHSARSPASIRHFSASPTSRIKEYDVDPDPSQPFTPKALWPHPIYTNEQMHAVSVTHRQPRDFSDRVALFAVRVLRTGLDLVSGYRHDKAVAMHAKDPAGAIKVRPLVFAIEFRVPLPAC